MSLDPVLSRLGLARKAKKLSLGFAAAKEACQAKKAELIIVGADVSAKSLKEITFFAGQDVSVVRIDSTIDEISAAIGFRAGIIAVNDSGFAKAILDRI